MASVSEELIARETAWMEAVMRKDFGTLEEILAPNYLYTASGQGRWSRQGWLDTVPRYDLHTFEILEAEVREYGDVAVVLSRNRGTATVEGVERRGIFLITDVWERLDNRWRVSARSSVLMPDAS